MARKALSLVAKSTFGRKLIQRLVFEGQHELGIGSGHNVGLSGEASVLDLFKHLDRKTTEPICIFDVGANHGQFLGLVDSCLRGPSPIIHCFEPSVTSFSKLRQKAGTRPNTFLNPFGLGLTAGDFPLYANEDGSCLASLSQRKLDHVGINFEITETVSISKLDDYCQKREIKIIDLLKLDVEGHELDVLQGAATMFRENRIRMVTFEFGGCNIDSRTYFQDFYQFFTSYGLHSIFRILPSGKLHKIERYSETLEQFQTTNFLAVSDSIAMQRVFSI